VKRIGKEVCQERKLCQVSGFTAVNWRSCQDSKMTKANRIKRKRHHQKSPRDDGAVNGRESQAVRRDSYRLSGSPFSYLLFIGFPPSKLPSSGLPGLYW